MTWAWYLRLPTFNLVSFSIWKTCYETVTMLGKGLVRKVERDLKIFTGSLRNIQKWSQAASVSSMDQVQLGKVAPTWLWAACICHLPHWVPETQPLQTCFIKLSMTHMYVGVWYRLEFEGGESCMETGTSVGCTPRVVL